VFLAIGASEAARESRRFAWRHTFFWCSHRGLGSIESLTLYSSCEQEVPAIALFPFLNDGGNRNSSALF